MKEINSLVLYFGAFLTSIFFVRIYQKNRKDNKLNKGWKKAIVVLGIMLPIIVIQGFRYGLGTDYAEYERIFNFMGRQKAIDATFIREPVFRFFCIAVRRLFGTPTAFFLLDAIIMNILFFLNVDYYREKVDMVIVYFAYYMLCFSTFLNIERQGVASMIVWYSFRYIEEKKFGKFLISILIATGIHNSAILFIILYGVNLINNNKIGKHFRGFIFAIVLFSPVFFRQLILLVQRVFPILSKYSNYFDMEPVREKVAFNLLFYIALFIIPIIFFRKSVGVFLKNSNYLVLSFILQIVFYFLDMYIDWGSRLVFYVYFGLMIMMGALCKQAYYKTNRNVFKVYFVLVLTLYYIRIYYDFGHANVFPYCSVWD